MSRVEKLMEYLAATPDDSFLQHALALEYIKMGDDAAAEKLFRNVLEKDPGYTGTYYHLGKLLERNNEIECAIKIYETGMEEAKKAGEKNAYGELRGAYEELVM